MKGASDEPNADAISTFLFAVSDAMVTRSLSGHLLSVVVFFLHPKRIRVIKLFHHLGTAGAGQEQPEQVDAVLWGKPAGKKITLCQVITPPNNTLSSLVIASATMTSCTELCFLNPCLTRKRGDGGYGVMTTFSNRISKFWLFPSDGSVQGIIVSFVTCPPAFIVPRYTLVQQICRPLRYIFAEVVTSRASA
jgi:hypothetical protein